MGNRILNRGSVLFLFLLKISDLINGEVKLYTDDGDDYIDGWVRFLLTYALEFNQAQPSYLIQHSDRDALREEGGALTPRLFLYSHTILNIILPIPY